MLTDELRAEAQDALEELDKERLLPFRLHAYKLSYDGQGIYTVEFYDSRLASIVVPWKLDEPFKVSFRNAILMKLKKLRDPLNKTLAAGGR